MSLKQCGKCSEMVDEAKAFCPECGNAFVDEEKREASNFEKMDNTVQLGQTMYNQMLSDMGLNISKSAPPREKRIEIIEPVATRPSSPSLSVAAKPASPRPVSSGKTKWLIVGAIVFLVFFLALLAAAGLLYIFWPRIV